MQFQAHTHSSKVTLFKILWCSHELDHGCTKTAHQNKVALHFKAAQLETHWVLHYLKGVFVFCEITRFVPLSALVRKQTMPCLEINN